MNMKNLRSNRLYIMKEKNPKLNVLGVFVLRKIKTYERNILQKKLSHCKVYKSQYLLIVLLLDAIKKSYI